MRRIVPTIVLLVCALAFYGESVGRAVTSQASLRSITVPASIDATGKSDVSAKMSAFFATVPDNAVVVLPHKARYRMDQTLELSGRHNLGIVGNGTTFVAVAQGDLHRSSLRIENSVGVIVYDLVIQGSDAAAGLADAAYQPTLEHQHGIEVLSVTNMAIVDVTVTNVYGDFVYISKTPHGPWSSNLLLTGNHFDRNGRQGIAITAARDIVISRNTIADVRAATFDFEPVDADGVDSVTITDNTIGAGRQLFVAANGHGSVNNVTISNNRLTSQALQIWAENSVAGRRIGWTVTGNTSVNVYGTPSGSVMRFTGVKGVEVSGNHQPFQPNRNMVVVAATNSCDTSVHDDLRPGSVGEARVVGHC